MIPLKLALQNVMCYRGETVLDFTGIHLACLTGDNGHGKSALLDAMTWALWGKARARFADELVTMGESRMRVELEWMVGAGHYRVVRSRHVGNTSETAIELEINDHGQFRSLAADTQHETQERINEILHMDYDTFVNSAFLVQGRADEFTLKRPAERKRILAEILGMASYDEYAERARNRARTHAQAEREATLRLQVIAEELELMPAHQQELQSASSSVSSLGEQIRELEQSLEALRGRVRTLEAQRSQLLDLQRGITAAKKHIAELDAQISSQRGRVEACSAVLERCQEIEDGYSHWRELSLALSLCDDNRTRYLALVAELDQAQRNLDEARRTLEVDRRLLEREAQELQNRACLAPELERELLHVGQQVERQATLAAEVIRLRDEMDDLHGQIVVLGTQNEQLRKEMVGLQEVLDRLQEKEVACPVCEQPLSVEQRQEGLQARRQEGKRKGDLYRANRVKVEGLQAKMESLRTSVRDIEQELKRLAPLEQRQSLLRESLISAREAERCWREQQAAIDGMTRQLQDGSYGATARQELDRLASEIDTLGYDASAHELLREEVQRLAHFEREHAELEHARKVASELQSNLEQLLTVREHLQETVDADALRQSEWTRALEELDSLVQAAASQARVLENLRRQEGHARQVVGAARQKLAYCQYLEDERRKRTEELDHAAGQRQLYEHLQEAFGKRGVQALIIESVIPELENDANALLARMTDGTMRLQFDTQRDLKSGNTMETFEIRISDESRTRSYELYSGGEAFRVNLAIRIALSKLLARRAGAQLQTLIIDEGFGTQDIDGRQRLVEAITSIKDDFARILVVTHIEELRDLFPRHIDVYKTAEGSRITVH